jgi:hypothetical protein
VEVIPGHALGRVFETSEVRLGVSFLESVDGAPE